MQERALNLIERNVRFATMTLVARYDAVGSGVRQPSLPDGNVICMDRASQLRDARVAAVHTRRPATSGHITQYLDEALAVPNKGETEALRAAFRTASSAFDSDDEKEPDFVFMDQPVHPDRQEKYGVEAIGGACECLLDDCSGVEWSKRFGDAYFDIPANPYKCWPAEKANGVWKFTLQ